MKKLLLLILGFLVVVIGFFAFSVFYSKSKTDLFFTANDGVLYKSDASGQITWRLSNSTSKIFNGEYTTEIIFLDKKVAELEHKAKFGLSGLNILKIGSIDTKVKIYKLTLDDLVKSKIETYEDYGDIKDDIKLNSIKDTFDTLDNVSYSSDIKFNGINAKIDIKGDLKESESKYGASSILWGDVKGNYLLSFERDTVDFNINAPSLSSNQTGVSSNFSLVLENQKYLYSASKRKVGVWLGDSSIKIGKIFIARSKQNSNYVDDYYDYYDDEGDYDLDEEEDYDADEEELAEITNTNFTLSNFNMLSTTKEGSDSTIFSDNKISIEKLIISENQDSKSLDDIVLNTSLKNLDLESFKKIISSIENTDLKDQTQLILLGTSLIEYIPDILAKHPKFAIDELSVKYANQTHKLNGFIQYVGSGNIQSIYKNLQNDMDAKLDINIGFDMVKNLSSYDELEDKEVEAKFKELGFEIKDNKLKGVIEYKKGSLTINGKQSSIKDLYGLL
ncbi:MAG: YdgA family protein [Campylobacteraceae bacterium]|jgi:hypothetical protein|nr:YdgA family protein [Campylobacteraceae bacterium]